MRFGIEPLGRFPLVGDSNFIFRAATAALAIYEGERAADELIDQASSDTSCAISNPLPEIEGRLFAPVGRWLFEKMPQDKKKDYKKMEYAEIAGLQDFILGKSGRLCAADAKFQLYEIEEERVEKIGNPHLQLETTLHNAVPRAMRTREIQTQLYAEKDVFYVGVKFWIYAYGSLGFLKMIKAAFQLLEQYGLGHGRTSGRGLFKLEQDENDGLTLKKSQEGILISALYPKPEEATDIDWEKSHINFELCRTVSAGGIFRESALMISAGSRICSKGPLPCGAIKKVGEGGLRGVYFGRALYI